MATWLLSGVPATVVWGARGEGWETEGAVEAGVGVAAAVLEGVWKEGGGLETVVRCAAMVGVRSSVNGGEGGGGISGALTARIERRDLFLAFLTVTGLAALTGADAIRGIHRAPWL